MTVSAHASEDPPTLIGRYRVEELVGRGGMGEVYRVVDGDFQRPLALKVLQRQGLGQARPEERFFREARLTGQLQHPGVPPVQEMGRLQDGRPYFIMKLVKGRGLNTLLAERAAPPDRLNYFLGVFEQICRTVAFAHAQGIIHRDLKPGNVMVGAFGEVQVMDWGLAKELGAGPAPGTARPPARKDQVAAGTDPTASTVDQVAAPEETGDSTRAGDVVGTPAYMAPEQARGEIDQVDQRADVFGLGGILCTILTGKPPFAAGNFQDNHRQAMQGDLQDALARLENCGMDAELTVLAQRCLAARPEQRFAHAGEVAEAVARYQELVRERLRQAELAGAQAQVRGEEEHKRLLLQRQKLRVTRRLSAAVVIVLVIGMVASMAALAQAWQAQRETEEQKKEAETACDLKDEALKQKDQAYLQEQAARDAELQANKKLAKKVEQLTRSQDILKGIFDDLDVHKVDKGMLVTRLTSRRRFCSCPRQSVAATLSRWARFSRSP